MDHHHAGDCCAPHHEHQHVNAAEMFKGIGSACCAGLCQHHEHALAARLQNDLLSNLEFLDDEDDDEPGRPGKKKAKKGGLILKLAQAG